MFRRRRRKQADFSAEIEAHIALEADRLQSEGLNRSEAVAAARRAFGNKGTAEEGFYERGHWLWWDHLRKDLVYACRTLRRSPTFTIAAVLTLSLGIGANTALFTVVDAALLHPLPYPDANRLVMLYERVGKGESFSSADFLDYQRESHAFEHLAAYREEPFNLTGSYQPQRIKGAVVTPDFFAVMKVPAQMGRVFAVNSDKPGTPLVILGHALWQARFAADPNILGKSVDIDGEPRTVVGVLPSSFGFPLDCQAWTLSRFAVPEQPLNPTVDFSNVRDSHYFEIIGRLKNNLTVPQAQADTDIIAARLKRQYGDVEEAAATLVIPLHDDLVGQTKPALLILLAAVALLLLIACINVANILLARATVRQKEIAVRGALGAGRLRIIRQLLTESLLMSAAGGLGAILLAYGVLLPLRTFVPSDMLAGATLKLNGGVLLFTAALSVLSGILFGLFPALQAAKSDIGSVLKEGGRSATGGRHTQRTRNLLVVSEIACATVLLIGAGLLIRSFSRVLASPAGFHTDGVLSLELSLSHGRYPQPEDRARFVQQILDRIQSVPGVLSAGVTSRLPLNPGNSSRTLDIKGVPSPSGGYSPDYVAASPNYFRSLGIPLLAGRTFNDRDTALKVVINQAAVHRYWHDKNPIGQLVTVGACGVEKQWCQVIGVVGNIRQHNLDQAAQPAVFVPYAKDPWPFLAIVVRTQLDPSSLAPSVTAAIHAIDKDQPLFHIRAMRDVVSGSLSARRFRMVLLGLFALIALLLACVGIYGVMAYSVAQRANEIGIRMALGAKPQQILRLMMGMGLKLAATGILAGVLLSLVLTRFLTALLYGVESSDLVTFLATAAVLLGVAALAICIPARRAMATDPMVALRAE